jgi:hypothetical protein
MWPFASEYEREFRVGYEAGEDDDQALLVT